MQFQFQSLPLSDFLWPEASSLPSTASSPFLFIYIYLVFFLVFFWRTLDQLGKLVLRPLLLAFAGRRSKYLKSRVSPPRHSIYWLKEGLRLGANASAWMSNETLETATSSSGSFGMCLHKLCAPQGCASACGFVLVDRAEETICCH